MKGGASFQFVVHPLPGSAEQLSDKLREVGEKLRCPQGIAGLSRSSPIVPGIPPPAYERGASSGSSSVSGSPSPGPMGGITIGARFDHSTNSSYSQVSQIEVGPSHFAFLLSDGRICRLPFSVISDRLDLSKSGSGGTNASNAVSSGSGGGSLASGVLGGGAGPSSSKSAKTSHSSSAGNIYLSLIHIEIDSLS